MRILVIGAGPVGLVTACSYAQIGYTVYVLENNPNRKELLKKGLVDFYEPKVSDVFKKHFQYEKIRILDSLEEGLKPNLEFIFVCVGTPSLPQTGETDLSAINKFIEEFVSILGQINYTEETNIIIKSTVPVGTTDLIASKIKRSAGCQSIAVCFSPEFLRQGSALDDFFNADRLVLGQTDGFPKWARRRFEYLHQSTPLRNKLIFTTSVNAELAKYASNAFLAMKITFANEIANFAQVMGASSKQVLSIVSRDHRIGEEFLRPGPGFGGSCFPKDLASLFFQSSKVGLPVTLAQTTLKANDFQIEHFVNTICSKIGQSRTVGLLGLAFKPKTNDLRYSPAIAMAKGLIKRGLKVFGYDLLVKAVDQDLGLELCANLDDLLLKTTVIVLTTDDQALFKELDYGQEKLTNCMIFDCRNVLPDEWKNVIKIV